MKRTVIALGLFVLSALWVMGCDRPPGPGAAPGTTRPAPDDHKTDMHVRTPGVRVDVEGKGEGKGVSVDVERKAR